MEFCEGKKCVFLFEESLARISSEFKRFYKKKYEKSNNSSFEPKIDKTVTFCGFFFLRRSHNDASIDVSKRNNSSLDV